MAGTLPGMAASRKSQHKFQPPKGTRDFYPEDMAVRRHIERAWRAVSINHGFEEIEGPTFEHLELYTMKSGEEIVSELFSFRRAGGETDYALRPEFTPTLARMVATRAAQLPRPIKWFCIPNHYRAERPQRGRLREFGQWNVDVVGDDSPRADAEVIACAVGVLERLGLSSEQITVKISHRDMVMDLLRRCGVEESNMDAALSLLDKKDRLPGEVFGEKAAGLGLDVGAYREAAEAIEAAVNGAIRERELGESSPEEGAGETGGAGGAMDGLIHELDRAGVLRWCEFDLNIVRGLAYYTGTVFEVHESTGKERAIAGGGRYDKLVEMFGGPPTPAVGVAMGDVVLRLVLEERGLLESGSEYLPRPDVFVVNARDEDEGVHLTPLLARLRGAGWHARRSYRATKNVGKLLGEAGKVRARYAVILGAEVAEGKVVVKNLEGGEQRVVLLDELGDILGEASASCGC